MTTVTVTDPALLTDLVETRPLLADIDPRADAKADAFELLTSTLTASQRDALQLRLEGFTFAQIGEMLNLSPWAVRGRIDRAMINVRKAAAKHGADIDALLGW